MNPNILRGAGAFAFEEKHSKFIAHCETVVSEEAARDVLNRIRAEHKTASHHVYAYGLSPEAVAPYTRHSDDGEPQGTAGLPALNVFIKNDIVNFICVITRYFGGTLLGAGGLTRAYSKAAKGALDAAGAEPLIIYVKYGVTCAYSNLSRLKYFCEKQGMEITEIDYTDRCETVVSLPETLEEVFLRNTDLFASRPPRRL